LSAGSPPKRRRRTHEPGAKDHFRRERLIAVDHALIGAFAHSRPELDFNAQAFERSMCIADRSVKLGKFAGRLRSAPRGPCGYRCAELQRQILMREFGDRSR